MNFSARLKQLRREQGLSQGELADAAGINRSYLSMVENDRSSPTMEVVQKLAKG
ncbi:MAG: helix-turn-helix transcriptional regulator, partial [Calditrichota bacterium]